MKEQYGVLYNDQSYIIYDLTTDDITNIRKYMKKRKRGIIEISTGFLNLKDIRSITKQEVRTIDTKTQREGIPYTDEETQAYLRKLRSGEVGLDE